MECDVRDSNRSHVTSCDTLQPTVSSLVLPILVHVLEVLQSLNREHVVLTLLGHPL